MLRNGYYFPVEVNKRLVRYDPILKQVVGDAVIAIDYGSRTGGKTVGWIVTLLQDYFNYGVRFTLVARTLKQQEKGYLEKWFRKFYDITESKDPETQEMIDKLKECDVEFSNDYITIDGEILCYCVALTQSSKVKDEMQFSRSVKLIMDEAMLPNERSLMIYGRPAMARILEIFITMARGWEFAFEESSIVFISNATMSDNWIFNNLNINSFWRDDSKFTCQQGIVVNKVNNQVVNDKIADSKQGQVFMRSRAGREYMESAIGNKFSDNRSFTVNKGLDFKQLKIQLVIRGHFIGVFELDQKCT